MFNRQNNQSAVFRQPVTDAERLHALRALVACPTNSIRTVPTTTTTTDSTPSTTKSQKPNAITAAKSFPLHYNNIPGVYYLGHASAHTFGAASWLLLRRDVVVMVDVPRYDANLASRIDALLKTHNRQAVDYILLTHCDDVAGHDAWAERLTGCQRIIHAADQSTAQGTDKCEVVLHDEDFELYDENVRRYCIGLGVYVLYVPGHTEGSLGVWDEETKTLFSGDHCWGGGGSGGIERESEEKWVTASDRFCFFDFDVQVENIAALRNLGVRNVLPGHGKPVMFGSEEEGRKAFAEAPGRIRGC